MIFSCRNVTDEEYVGRGSEGFKKCESNMEIIRNNMEYLGLKGAFEQVGQKGKTIQ